MNYTIVRIAIVIILVYSIGLIVAGFTEFAMDKKILDINNTYTKVNIIMPHGTHHDLELEYDMSYVLEGNITIKQNNKIIYSGIVQKPYGEFNSSKLHYSLISNGVQFQLFKKNKKYEVKIELKKVVKPIALKVSWLERKYGD